MTNAYTDHAQALTRRGTLAGLAAAAGTVALSAAPPASASPAPALAAERDARPAAPAPAHDASPTPGAMQLFTDPGLNFNALLALGGAGFGASEVGEVLTAVNAINAAGANEQTYDAETFYPGQPRAFFDLLRTRKEFRLMRAATVAQLHCSPMAPQQHCEVVFDWLADTLGRGARG